MNCCIPLSEAMAADMKPSDIIGIRSNNCVGRVIRWCSTRSRRKLSKKAPNHLAQIIWDYDRVLWEEASVTTKVPCVLCGQFKGVHVRAVEDRLREEIRRGSTIYRYRFVKPFTEAEQALLASSWRAKHRKRYDYKGAYDARLRGGGRILASRWYQRLPEKWRLIPDRSKNGKWFCNEAVLDCLRDAGRWNGNPSRWNPATAVADLLERGVVEQTVIWEPSRRARQMRRMRAKYAKAAERYQEDVT